jgi:hypothetical protein
MPHTCVRTAPRTHPQRLVLGAQRVQLVVRVSQVVRRCGGIKLRSKTQHRRGGAEAASVCGVAGARVGLEGAGAQVRAARGEVRELVGAGDARVEAFGVDALHRAPVRRAAARRELEGAVAAAAAAAGRRGGGEHGWCGAEDEGGAGRCGAEGGARARPRASRAGARPRRAAGGAGSRAQRRAQELSNGARRHAPSRALKKSKGREGVRNTHAAAHPSLPCAALRTHAQRWRRRTP